MIVSHLLEKLAFHVGAIGGHGGKSNNNDGGMPEQFGRVGQGDVEVAAKFIPPAREEVDAALPKVYHFRERPHGVAVPDDQAGEARGRQEPD
jgi:hypothetical protein